ncbi:hypothetical protein Anas_07043 [Armadillidium nasatum]|uniref:Uncharacterized protein n=1 Tax=Armadillidium nasatum TaxID=96803 RepID=A0A5N5T2N2_9CRUS|nr:hypothetical protein Anas_07043 [Armadillidium nasatum]
MNWNDASVKVSLSSYLWKSGHSHNRATRSVLRNQMGRSAIVYIHLNLLNNKNTNPLTCCESSENNCLCQIADSASRAMLAISNTNLITFCNHHFLSYEHFFSWNFNSKITSCNHNAVRFLNDGINIFTTLMIFNFANNFNVFSLFAKDTSDFLHTCSISNERCENHIHLLLNTENEIPSVLL